MAFHGISWNSSEFHLVSLYLVCPYRSVPIWSVPIWSVSIWSGSHEWSAPQRLQILLKIYYIFDGVQYICSSYVLLTLKSPHLGRNYVLVKCPIQISDSSISFAHTSGGHVSVTPKLPGTCSTWHHFAFLFIINYNPVTTSAKQLPKEAVLPCETNYQGLRLV